jgi:Zn-dependent protease
MAITSFTEIFYILILTLAIGFIFSGYIRIPGLYSRGFNWRGIKFAILVTAPAIVLHELAHKFAGLAFGYNSMFNIWWPGLGLGIFLRLIGSPFLILAPGYVSVSPNTSLELSIIAFAGPFINLALFSISILVLRFKRRLKRKEFLFWHLTKIINMWLFIFNMIPIPPLDGSKVIGGLLGWF